MTTKLDKPVSRSTVLITDNRIEARAFDEVTVTLYPRATIGFRARNSRKEYCLSLAKAYELAMQADAETTPKRKRMNRGKL